MRIRLVVALAIVAAALVGGGVLVTRSWRFRRLFVAARDRGVAHFKAGNYDSALACFQEAFERDPADALVLRGLARCQKAKGDLPTAAYWAEEAAKVDSTPAGHVLAAEIANLQAGRWEPLSEAGQPLSPEALACLPQAAAHARAAMDMDARNEPACRALAEAVARQGDRGEALRLTLGGIQYHPESVQLRMLAAKLLVHDGKLDQALEHCLHVVEKTDPANQEARRLAVDIYGLQERYDKAIEVLQQLLDLQDDEASTRIKLARCYLFKGQDEEAVSQADLAARFYQGERVNWELLFIRGIALTHLKRFDKAAVDLNIAASRNRKNADIQFWLGLAYLGSQQPDLARDAFLRTIEIDPARLDARLRVAELLADAGETEGALRQFRQRIEQAPDDLRACEMLVDFCLRRGLYREAEGELRRLLQLQPGSGPFAAWLCQLRLRDGDGEEAVMFARAARRARPDHPAYMDLEAQAEAARADWDAAARAFAEEAQRVPDKPEVYLRWAEMNERAGRPIAAEAVYRQALGAVPGSADIRLAYARFLQGSGRRREALEMAKTILRGHENEVTVWVALVDLYLRLGMTAEARKTAGDAVARFPGSVPAQAALARVHRDLGEWQKFLGVLSKIATELDPDADATYQRLAGHLHEGHYAAAVSVGEDALRRHPERQRRTLLDLAVARFLAGQHQEAIESVSILVSQDRFDPDAGLLLSFLRLASHEPTGQVPACDERALPPAALAAWSDLVDLNSREPGVAARVATALMKASVYDHAGWEDLAAAECTAILGFAPRCRMARLLVPTLLERAGQRAEAIAYCDRVLADEPGAADIAELRADLLLLDGRLDKAAADYARVGHLQGVRIGPLTKGALLAQAAASTDAAMAAWREILKYDPQNVLARNNLACLVADSGKDSLAAELESAKLALEVESGNAAILDTVGWLHFRLGQYAAALARLKAAAALAPHRALYQYHLGMACWKSRKLDEAAAALDKAIELDPQGPVADQARQALAQCRF